MVSWSHHERGSPQNDHTTRPSRRVSNCMQSLLKECWCFVQKFKNENVKSGDMTAAKKSLDLKNAVSKNSLLA